MPYIDMHCDTLMKAWMHNKKDILKTDTMVDLQRLKENGCKCQFFAIFMPPITFKKHMGPLYPGDENYIAKNLSIFKNSLLLNSDIFAKAENFGQMEENWENGKVSGLLTLEDGRAVNGSMDNLERFYKMGIRLISLTWNNENCFGFPNSADDVLMKKGLTPFGKEALLKMGELGMLVDVSHLSDGGFCDVAQIVKGPFVASHSNCRSLNPHPRSLTDEMIRVLAEHGGVMGLNICPEFLGADIGNKKSTVDDMVKQLLHMRNTGGIECVAIGTDFDGITGDFEVKGPEDMHILFEELKRNGFTEGEIEKISHKNAERVMKEVLK